MTDKTPGQRFDQLLRKAVQSTRSSVPESQRLERLLREFRALHPKPAFRQRLAAWLGASLHVPVPAMALVALLVIAQGIAVVKLMPQEQAATDIYRGAGVPCADGPRIRAVFKPDANYTEVLILLRKVEATVVAGPSETGQLWLRIPKGYSIDEAASLLKASALVDEAIVVEPAGKGCTP